MTILQILAFIFVVALIQLICIVSYFYFKYFR